MAQHFPYHQFTVDDGLPSNFVYGATQDDEGYIWVYTDKGVAKFDGYKFKTFSVQDGLPINDIWGMTKDTKGRLWLHGFSTNLTYIQNDSVRTAYRNKIYDNSDLYPVTTRITENGLVLLNNMNKQYLYLNDSLYILPYLDHIKATPDSIMAYAAIINYLNCDTIPATPLVNNFLPETYYEIAKPPLLINARQHYCFKEFIFYRSDSSVVCFNTETFSYKEILFDDTYGGSPAFLSYAQAGDSLQIYSDLKLHLLNADTEILKVVDFTHLAQNEDIVIHGSFLDDAANVWIATREDGVFLATAKQQKAQMIHDANISTLSGLGDYLFIGTAEGDIYLQDTSYQNTLIRSGDNLEYDIVRAIISQPRRGGVFTGVEKEGISFYNLEAGAFLPREEILMEHKVFIYENLPANETSVLNLAETSHWLKRTFFMLKDICLDTTRRALYEASLSDVWQYQTQNDTFFLRKISDKRATSIAVGGDGKVWIGHVSGLGSYFDKRYELAPEKTHPLLKAYVNTLVTDGFGNVWVGTDGHGVYAYNGEEVFEVSETKGDIVKEIYFDYEGYLWLSTNQGVKQLSVVFGDTLRTKALRHLQTKDGLPTNAVNCVYVDSSFIYVGTDKGLIKLAKESFEPAKKEIQLYLEHITINGRKLPIQDTYTFQHYERELEMAFTALSYESLQDIEYHYRLNHHERDTQVKKSRRIRYAALNRGEHHFEIYATDVNGNKSNVIAFDIKILYPWWQMLWFRGLLLLMIGVVLYTLYRYRVRFIKRRAAERSHFEQQIAAYELQALQSQMNPHFIFNALTTIQYFIQRNDKKSATKYLTTFGDLTRAFLEASKRRYISLEQELELLKMYIDLEQMRFDKKFELNIVIDDDIDIYTTEIPSTLLQPFVENAINHGFFHKDGKGHLDLIFKAHANGGILCIIKDDGIGREQAKIIKENSIRKHKSRGTQLVDERLAVLSKMEGYDIKVKINDVLDADQEVAGTEVQISIPEIA